MGEMGGEGGRDHQGGRQRGSPCQYTLGVSAAAEVNEVTVLECASGQA